MSQPPPLSPETVLRGYFHAKDENRPHVLARVFALDANLTVINNAINIEFPAQTNGQEAIAEVLVSRFNQTYENIYSFYLASPPARASAFSCDWLVGMTEKESKNVRVGCGRYDWTFQAASPHLASRLVVTIEVMQLLPASQFGPVFSWLQQLNYPWSSTAQVKGLAPNVQLLAPVLQYVARNDDGV